MIYQFETFEVDDREFRLLKSGALVQVEPKVLRLLLCLIENRNRLVRKQELLDKVWQDAMVTENALTRVIGLLRKALNDDSHVPRFIETVPTAGYRFIANVTVLEESSDGAAKTVRNRIRIGILPIEDLEGSVEDYFAVGLTEDMISALSRIDPERLRVIVGPRAPSGILPRERLDRLRREFDLDYLLRGSVRRSAESIRISAQLLDLRDKSVLWSEVYDRQSSDLHGMQDEVARRVSQSLALELLPGGILGSRKYARCTAAYDAYLKGRFFWHKMTPDATRSSIAYFNEALTTDPEFAPAYAGLADCYAQMGSVRLGMLKPFAALAKARTYLQRAMELDYTMAEAHCTSGLIKIWYEFDWAGAEQEFKVALSLDPGQVTALLWQSLYLSVMGRHQEAVASVQRARDSEPLSAVVNMYLGITQAIAGQYDLGLRQLNQAVELDPYNYRSFMFLGKALSDIERFEDAIAAFQKALSINPDNLEALAFMGAAMAAEGNRPGALKVMERVIAAESRTSPAILVACIYARLGDASQMFDWLRKAVEQRSVPVYIPLISDEFRPYRSDPRFGIFLDSIGLPHLANARGPGQCSD